MARTDRRVERTKRAIKEEVRRQMLRKKYQELTVTDICSELDISRRTFYVHYSGIEAVFGEIFEDVNAPLFEQFDQLKETYQAGDASRDRSMVREILRLINEKMISNQEYLARIATEPSYAHQHLEYIQEMRSMISQALNNTDLESGLRKTYLDYFISGVLELYNQWYQGTTDLSLEEISDFACDLIRTDVKYFLSRKENESVQSEA